VGISRCARNDISNDVCSCQGIEVLGALDQPPVGALKLGIVTNGGVCGLDQQEAKRRHCGVLSYDVDETVSIIGQHLNARFHATDTWPYRDGKRQMVAGQVFRYYENPAWIKLDPKSLDRYVGTSGL
jgi:hypothetical protein